MSNRIYILTLIILFAWTAESCKKKMDSRNSWDADYLIPLVHGSMGIKDLAGDTVLSENQDGQLSLVYRNSLYNLNLNDGYIGIPDTSLRQAVRLDSIRLPDRTIFYPISLGQMALADQTGTGALIIALNGSTAPIPAISNLSSFDRELDATDFFEEALLDGGYLDIEVRNGFPVDITDLIYRLKNKVSGDIIIEDTFAIIPKNATVLESYDLSGKMVEGKLLADIVRMSTPGSGGIPVPIDTSDAIELTVSARDLVVHSATAIFPAQNLVDIKNEVVYDMGGAEFTQAIVRTGDLVISAVNTIEDTMYLHYQIPGATDPFGNPIDIRSAVPPAPPGGSVKLDENFDISGYTIDLTGKDKMRVNRFYNEFTARIDSTGKLISVSLDDSIIVYYGLQNIVPQYVKGYMGTHNIQIGPEITPLDFFKNFKNGQLDLEKVKVSFAFNNEVGIDASVKIHYLKASNQLNGTSVDLTAPFINNQQIINRAYDNPFVPGTTFFELDNSNSNIKSLLESLPDQLEYAIDVNVNPKGNYYNYQDFVDFDKSLDISMDLEIPLSLKATNLQLVDTIPFSLQGQKGFDNIREIGFTFIVDNSFPLSANTQLYFLDGNNKVIDSLFSNLVQVATGIPVAPLCKVEEMVKSRFVSSFDQERTEKIKKAEKAVVKAFFNTGSTPSCNNYLKIYSDYQFEFKLTGKFKYRLFD